MDGFAINRPETPDRKRPSRRPRPVRAGVALLLVGLGLAVPPVRGQDESSSTERAERLTGATGTARIELLIELADEWAPRSLDRSVEYGREALELARAAGDSSRAGRALLSLARAHIGAREYDRSLQHGLQARRAVEGIENASLRARVLNTLGTIHQSLGEYDQAADLYGRSLAIARGSGDRLLEARNLNSLGVNAWYEEDYARALSAYRECLEVQDEIGDRRGSAATLNNVAMIHHIREEYDEALEHYERSLEIKREIGDDVGVAATLGNLGELCLSVGRYPQALVYLERSRDLAAELNAGEVLTNSHYSLADYHAAVGDHEAALREYRTASEQEKETFSARNAAIVAEMQAKYEAEKSALEIDRLHLANARTAHDLAEQRGARDRMLAYLVISIAMLILVAWLYRRQLLAHRRVRAQAEELEQAASKIAALTDLLPICATCKMIRDADGNWHRMESYLKRHADLTFTHGICPHCEAQMLEELENA